MVKVGLDTGERAGKTVSAVRGVTGNVEFESHHDPVAALSYLRQRFPGEEIRVYTESSTCNFDPEMRNQFLAVARRLGIDLYPTNPRHTKNRRKDWGYSKDDATDAHVLLLIGEEGIIPRQKGFGKFRELSEEPSVRLRQLHYDYEHSKMRELLPELPELVETIKGQPVPDCAIVASAAVQLKKTRRYASDKYHFLTPLVEALVLAKRGELSNRKLKAVFRDRGLPRSNYMFHPLKKKSREERKVIMRAQDEFKKFVVRSTREWWNHR